MKNNRKFLVPLAVLASVFVSHNAAAIVNTTDVLPITTDSNNQVQSAAGAATSVDPFEFILKRAGQAKLADEDDGSHSSHSSHASHSSHSSHQSGDY